MRIALDEARQADFPFGAVIVQDGSVIARGRNLGRANGDPTAHGEMVAIRRCLADKGAVPLRGSTLYTSGEPCAMCMGAIVWSRIARVVFAASIAQLATKIVDQEPAAAIDRRQLTRMTLGDRSLEREVLQLIAEGKSNKLIADALKMSESTVKAHVKQIIKRLHVANRTQAALIASRASWQSARH